MSAAPVSADKKQSDAKIRAKIAKLEANLDSRIVTIAKREYLEAVAPAPKLRLVKYPRFLLTPRVQRLRNDLARAKERVEVAVGKAK